MSGFDSRKEYEGTNYNGHRQLGISVFYLRYLVGQPRLLKFTQLAVRSMVSQGPWRHQHPVSAQHRSRSKPPQGKRGKGTQS